MRVSRPPRLATFLSSFLDPRRAILAALIAVVTVLAIVPVFFLVWNSFKATSGYEFGNLSLTADWTIRNFTDAYSDPRAFKMLGDSFFFSFGAMITAFILGGVLAFLVERTNMPFRNAVYGFMFVPLALPGILKAIAWILILSPKIGLLNQLWFGMGFTQPLFNAYTIPAMFWVEGLSMSPLTFLMLGAALRVMDPSLEEAAYTSGSGRWSTLGRITLRLMTPALAAIALLQFIRGLSVFEVPLIMGLPYGIQVFATNIYYAVREVQPPQYGHGFAYSMAIILISVAGLLVYQRVMRHSERYATVTGKGFRPRIMDLGKWRPLAGAFAIFFSLVTVFLPFAILLWASFLLVYEMPTGEALSRLTWANYEQLFGESEFMVSIKNTLIMGGSVAIGAMGLSIIISWMVIRLRTRYTALLDYIVFVPYAVPSIAVGLAFMVFFLSFPNPIYGSIWILVLAYLVHFLPIGTRFTHTAVGQVRVELEEAASISGANLFTMLRRIIVPLILPSLVAGGLFIFLLTVKVMSIAMLLYSTGSNVLPVLILQYWKDGSIGLTSALSVVMLTALVIIIILSRVLIQRRSIRVTE